MAILTVWQDGRSRRVPFEPPKRIMDVLKAAGIDYPHPCGGFTRCLKCRVEAEGEISVLSESERRIGSRLSCVTQLFGDARVTLPAASGMEVETGGITGTDVSSVSDELYRAAVDIGTTTVAMKVYRGSNCVYTGGVLNPQTAVSADVMGRIGASKDSPEIREKMKDMVTETIRTLAAQSGAAEKIGSYVITGNTTMLYLLTGENPEALSHAPFEADDFFDREIDFLDVKAYLPKCMHAFVGADITTAVYASGMCEKNETALLCDVGTNGEIALWKGGRLYVTSTAAGPAFEGAGIEQGSGSIPGAVDAVKIVDRKLSVHTIQGKEAASVCGSGLVDAVACGLELEVIDDTGLIDEELAEEIAGFETEELMLTEKVKLTQKDIRAVQLAKAAISAGIKTLLHVSDVQAEEIGTFYIAGGFGSHLNAASAIRIGLFPAAFKKKTVVLGNAALAGAVQVLLDPSVREKMNAIAEKAQHVNLGGNPEFNETYMDEMFF